MRGTGNETPAKNGGKLQCRLCFLSFLALSLNSGIMIAIWLMYVYLCELGLCIVNVQVHFEIVV